MGRRRPEYLDGLRESAFHDPVPVRAKKVAWTIEGSPRYMTRTFEVSDLNDLCAFVAAAMEVQQFTQHPMRVTVDFPVVIVELTTQGVGDVTERDTAVAKKLDDLLVTVSDGALDISADYS
jgi:pterin-4a-carbinolamine dehydratase